MRVAKGIEPIAEDELLYRRVPASTGWYDPATGDLKPGAFGPHKRDDVTGLSLVRAAFKSASEAACGRPGKSYYLAVLRASDLRKNNIMFVPRPDTPRGFDPAHAELPQLNSENYKTDQTLELQQLLVTLCIDVQGPFGPAQQ